MSLAPAGANATRRWDSSSGGGSTTRTLVPQVLEVVERQLLTELVEVVAHVDDQDLVGTTIEPSTEPPADHLLVDVRAERGTRDIHRSHRRGVEPLGEHSIIGDDSYLAATEALDVVAPLRWVG